MAPQEKNNVQALDADTFDALAKKDNDPTLTVDELIARFAVIQNITEEEARTVIGADTPEEVLKKIQDYTIKKVREQVVHLNRAQRRALQKKYGKGAKLGTLDEQQAVINETAQKLSYIDLIQKLRKLNEEKAKETDDDGETDDQTD